MRKRTQDEGSAPEPRPFGHPLVTIDGETAPARLWGKTEALAIPLDAGGTPEGAPIEAADEEYFTWVTSPRLDFVECPELLRPDGGAWKDAIPIDARCYRRRERTRALRNTPVQW